jgi:hypothetical protein
MMRSAFLPDSDRSSLADRTSSSVCFVNMKREMWGTYSVRDHTFEHPFAADVVLYDKLAVPVPPPPESPEHETEWKRWEQSGWKPALQQKLLAVLGERAVTIPWDAGVRAIYAQTREQERQTAQRLSNAFVATGDVVLERLIQTGQLPADAGAINAVATYRKLGDLEGAIGLHEITEATRLPAGQAVVVVGRELLVPDSSHYKTDGDLLKAALELSAKTEISRRQAYWDWQQRFFSQRETDYRAIRNSVKDMAELLAEEENNLRRERRRLTTMFVLTISGIGLTLAGTPIGPFVLGGAFVEVGKFAVSEWIPGRPDNSSPAALLYDARPHLGWEKQKFSWRSPGSWRRLKLFPHLSFGGHKQ